MAEQGFEQQITPESQKEFLRGQIEKQPERAKEIMGDYLQKEPEVVYGPEKVVGRQEMSEMEKRIVDVRYEERENAVQYLFQIARDKGLLYASRVAKKADPSVMEEFHDRLVNYLYPSG